MQQAEGGMDGSGNLAPTLTPGMHMTPGIHMTAMMAADGTPLPQGEGGLTPGDQSIVVGTPKTGKSSARRSHTRWTESETMRLIDGVGGSVACVLAVPACLLYRAPDWSSAVFPSNAPCTEA